MLSAPLGRLVAAPSPTPQARTTPAARGSEISSSPSAASSGHSSRGAAQAAVLLHFCVESDRIEIETVRPSQNPIVKENAGEEGGITQRFHHLTALADEVREVALAFAPVREGEREPVTAARLDPHRVDQLEHRFRAFIHALAPNRTRQRPERS